VAQRRLALKLLPLCPQKPFWDFYYSDAKKEGTDALFSFYTDC